MWCLESSATSLCFWKYNALENELHFDFFYDNYSRAIAYWLIKLGLFISYNTFTTKPRLETTFSFDFSPFTIALLWIIVLPYSCKYTIGCKLHRLNIVAQCWIPLTHKKQHLLCFNKAKAWLLYSYLIVCPAEFPKRTELTHSKITNENVCILDRFLYSITLVFLALAH